MAFSIDLKNELSSKAIDSEFVAISELSAFIRTNGTIVMNNSSINVRFETTNNSTIRRIFRLLKFVYKYEGKIVVSKISHLRKNSVYKLIIDDDLVSRAFLTAVGFFDLDSFFIEDSIYKSNIKSKEFIKDFLRGAFLGSGSISNPDRSYHLEITLNSFELAKILVSYMKVYKISAKILEKKGQFLVYLKDSEQISTFLTVIGSVNALFKFEEIRMIKEIKNNTNRITNCETANLDKTLNTAFSQIDAINIVYKKIGKENLEHSLLELCELRLKNPTYSLQKLADILNISKSGVNHKLNKIIKLSKE